MLKLRLSVEKTVVVQHAEMIVYHVIKICFSSLKVLLGAHSCSLPSRVL